MISCSEYDYIEIACCYRYPIRLTLKSGEIVDGIAKDTTLNKGREECICIEVKGIDRMVVLDEIHKMEVKVEIPHFKSIIFNNN